MYVTTGLMMILWEQVAVVVGRHEVGAGERQRQPALVRQGRPQAPGDLLFPCRQRRRPCSWWCQHPVHVNIYTLSINQSLISHASTTQLYKRTYVLWLTITYTHKVSLRPYILPPFQNVGHFGFFRSIILLFGQQTEPPRSLSRPRNSHVNREKIEK